MMPPETVECQDLFCLPVFADIVKSLHFYCFYAHSSIRDQKYPEDMLCIHNDRIGGRE